jgi:hypothetical protein
MQCASKLQLQFVRFLSAYAQLKDRFMVYRTLNPYTEQRTREFLEHNDVRADTLFQSAWSNGERAARPPDPASKPNTHPIRFQIFQPRRLKGEFHESEITVALLVARGRWSKPLWMNGIGSLPNVIGTSCRIFWLTM